MPWRWCQNVSSGSNLWMKYRLQSQQLSQTASVVPQRYRSCKQMFGTRHPRDIDDEQLTLAAEAAERPELLRELVAIGRETFGFYPKHFTATLYYPWVAAR